MSLPQRPEWADVAIHTDLRITAEQLLFIASELSDLARSWAPAVRERITLQAEEIREWGEIALLARDGGDTWQRLEALRLAQERTQAADVLLQRWRHRTNTHQDTQPRATPARARSIG